MTEDIQAGWSPRPEPVTGVVLVCQKQQGVCRAFMDECLCTSACVCVWLVCTSMSAFIGIFMFLCWRHESWTQLTMWTNSCWPRNENCQNTDNLKWELCSIKENCHPALCQKPLGNPPKRNYLLIWGWRPGRPMLSLSTRLIGLCIAKPSLLPYPKASASTLLEGQFPCDYIPDQQKPWWVLGKWIWGPGSCS